MNQIRRMLGVASMLWPLISGGCGADATDPAALSDLNTASAALSASRPVLSAISPRLASNRGGTPLLLTGTNFAVGATVRIAGVRATSSVLSSTTIAVTLPAHPRTCGLVTVRVDNPTGEHAARSDLFTYLGEFGYGDPLQYPTVAYTNEIAVADFNLDGHPDLAIGTFDESPVSFIPGVGDGTFRAARKITAGGVPASVLAGDWNGDGSPDLAVSDLDVAATGHILLGNGRALGGAQFGMPKDFTALEDMNRLKSADLNSDGKLDLITIGDSSVGALLGKGDGTFAAHLDVKRTTRPWDVAIADLNGDGHPDLVLANLAASSVSVLLGKGDGTFRAGTDYATDKSPIFVAIADVDDDGKLDVVSGNARTVSILAGFGDGTLKTARNVVATAHSLNDLALADLDADGRLDIAVVDELGSAVNVLFNQGDGAFAPPVSFPTGAVPNWMGIGDFDSDHRLDFAVTSFTSPGSVAILLRQCM